MVLVSEKVHPDLVVSEVNDYHSMQNFTTSNVFLEHELKSIAVSLWEKITLVPLDLSFICLA